MEEKPDWEVYSKCRDSDGALCLFIFAMDFLGIANDPETGVPDTAPGMNNISSTIELFSSMAFLVFTGVMLSSFIVSAYKNKTMNLMFSYPVKRQKILVSQMLAVWIFNFCALVLAKLLMYGCILAGSRFLPASFSSGYDMGSLNFYVQLLLKSAVIVSMGFIALFIGPCHEVLQGHDYHLISADIPHAG